MLHQYRAVRCGTYSKRVYRGDERRAKRIRGMGTARTCPIEGRTVVLNSGRAVAFVFSTIFSFGCVYVSLMVAAFLLKKMISS